MDYHQTFTQVPGGEDVRPVTKTRVRWMRRFKPAGLPFMAQWMLAVSSAMLLAGLVESGLAQQQIVERVLEGSLRNYEVLASGLEEVLAMDVDPKLRETLIADEMRHVGHSYGTVYAGLFDAQDHLLSSVGGGNGDPSGTPADAAGRQAVLETGRGAVGSDEGADAARHEFVVPVSTPDGMLVLEIEQQAGIVTDLVADLRSRNIIGFLLAVGIALPLSYILGGRSLHRRQQRARSEADFDALTNLAGRRPFRPALEASLANKTNTTVTLALIDLDGFKQINDRLGHSQGDRVLRGLTDSFKELRASDTAYRLGGDEFAVILPGSDEERAAEALNRVRESLAKSFPGVSFSAGIASSTASVPVALQELWERADAALYEAKGRGRRQSVTFGSMASGHSVSTEKIEALMALVQGQTPIAVAFQPIWDLRRGVVLAHEALLRLPKESPIVGPQEAFDLAERLGLAPTLDALARGAVLAAVKDRQWEGLLFLNIHPGALAGLDIDHLIAGLAAAGLEPADVVLEVTEQAGLDCPEPIRTLTRAHERGFRLALDDMGQGNAGLHALTLVRFDIIKIDAEVISRLGTDPSASATVAAAMTFVGHTGGWVVAEGIEEDRMLAALLQCGCEEGMQKPVLAGQGYLLGRPGEQPVGLDSHLTVLESQHPSRPETDDLDRIGSGNP
ncbi:EAL domain-containing protein [Paeniglutamicibacter cryotolerans]|uniref:Diguanylate cyclase (GGDEF)-like protein n=1 Tax=Paeniglutamicibacter cryotolerans TaxID=670079 RepID=A0A839QLJ0_9MICC|nr:EAL domain-containing protein [Paeniglutamicibacter cryotolerans]MBB2997288.1 diguanylate cyclase (GGDEF)-like protein [Paeniglutamicibacter cryotolerans]